MKATALYKTDFHHSYNSRELIGIFTNERKYIKEVKRIIKEDIKTDSGNRNFQEEKDYINWNVDFFFENNQTQGLNNFEIISEQLNKNSIK